jgi:hypothetical protein
VLTEDAAGLTWEAWQGKADQHLDELLVRAEGTPLFLFLDPYGHGLSSDRLMTALATRPSQRWSPPTEALIRIDSAAVFRTRGALHADPYPARDAKLRRLDLTAGGSWWRDADDTTLPTEAHLEWFSSQLLHRVCQQWKWAGWTVPVQRKAGRVPLYYLLFLTQHRDGMTVFNDALSLATAQWRRRILELTFEQSLFSENLEETFALQEAELESEWVARLKSKVVELLAEMPSFVVVEQLERVFAGVLGLARQKHFRVALKELHAEKVTSPTPKASSMRSGPFEAEQQDADGWGRPGPVRASGTFAGILSPADQSCCGARPGSGGWTWRRRVLGPPFQLTGHAVVGRSSCVS